MRDEAVVGLCLAASGVTELPARPWPLDAAFQRLAALLRSDSPYAASAAHAAPDGSRRGDVGTERLLRLLAQAGRAGQHGKGASAGWRFDPAWTAGWTELLGGLPARDRAAFDDAGQVLASCVSTWRSAASRASA